MVLGVHTGSVKIKKYLHPDVVMMHLLHKGFMENYRCWHAHGEIFVRKKSMGEGVVGSTFSASNVHEAANNNTNSYTNMVMYAYCNIIHSLSLVSNIDNIFYPITHS